MAGRNSPELLIRAALIRRHAAASAKALATTASTTADPFATAPFATAKELASKLAELPKAYYAKPKSTESFLSQIFRGEAPFPIVLRDEILRHLKSSSVYTASEYSAFEKKFSFIVTAHNQALKNDDSALDYAKEQLLAHFWVIVRSIKSAEHFVISSRAMREANPDVITALFEVQAPALKLTRPSEAETNQSVYVIGKSLGDPLWERDKNDETFTHVVESRRSALSLWRDLFSHLCEKHIYENGRYISQTIPDDIKIKVAQQLQSTDIETRLNVLYLEEDFGRICANLVIAINPSSLNDISVFSAVDGWVIPFSKHESHTWRELVYVAKGDFLGKANACRWQDVEPTILSEPLLSSNRKNIQ